MNTKIVVDTSVWIEFFRNSESGLSRHLSTLLRERRVVMVGMVLAEILKGIKAQKEAKAVKESLSKLPYLEITKSVWEKAGDLSATLGKKGVTVPLSDLVIAAAALSADHEVFTVDPHFKKVPGLKLHTTLYQ